jgi:hypothetical protein
MLLAVLITTSIPIFAQPTITSVSPVAGPLGTTLTITGSGFDPVTANDAVYLGPVKAPILTASATTLTVKVPTGTAYAPLIVWADGLTSYPAAPFVLDWPGGGVIDSGYSFKYAGGPGLATGGPDYTSNSMAVYDLDGDGYPDIVANYSTIYPPIPTYGASGFTVWQNQGVADSLVLASAYTYSYGAGNAPNHIAIQDLDGDGKPDIAVDSGDGSTIKLFLNTSSGGHISFAPQGTLPDSLLPGGAGQILLLDFNGDGKPDIVMLNGDSLIVLINTSTVGHLSFIKTTSNIPGGGAFVAADFDGDGKPDLAILNGSGPSGNGNTITIYSNGNPAFTITTNAASLAAGDLNGDGKPDIVTSNFSPMGAIVSVYHNITTSIGHPNFTETDYSYGFTDLADGPLAIGDADGDGKPDVVYLGGPGDNVLVMKNTSTADSIMLQPPLLFSGSEEPVQLFIGDLDGTGRNNIASLGEARGNLDILKYVQPPPVITAFSPDTAYTGDTVRIRGSYFTGATAVLLGDVSAASYNVTADTLITAVVGTGATGEVTVTTASGSDSLGGFVFFKPPPPFRLVSFTGKLLAGQAVLQWQVTGAAGISSYLIEQATDTMQFNIIGTVSGNGADSSNYSFTDTTTRQGTIYYQLGIIDTTANITYSNSIAVVWPVIPTIFNAYPNPARNFLTLTLPANSSPSTVRIVDMSGAVVQQTAVAAGTTQVNFDLTQMTSGVYLLEWSSTAGEQTKLILVFK